MKIESGSILLELCFIAAGYLSGSILFARLAAGVVGIDASFPDSPDGNPGTSNAFRYGGFWCGMTALAGDLLKGFLPIWLYLRSGGDFSSFTLLKPFVLVAPVLGHVFPVFYRFRGGKGIATTFGCLLGLLPAWRPVLLLAGCFIFFSVVLRITPHFYRTIAAYLAAALGSLLLRGDAAVTYGFLWITVLVLWKLHQSGEKPEPMEVAWMH